MIIIQSSIIFRALLSSFDLGKTCKYFTYSYLHSYLHLNNLMCWNLAQFVFKMWEKDHDNTIKLHWFDSIAH